MKIQSGYQILLARTQFKIESRLTTCRNLNNTKTIRGGEPYVAELHIPFGYQLESENISIVMGGVDVTANVLNGNTITIPQVVGDVVITATGTSAGLTAGLYQDGVLVTSWADIVSSHPNAFTVANTIQGYTSSTIDGYLKDLEGDLVIDSSIITLARNAFAYSNKLTNIYVPSTVTSIGQHAFANTSSLKELVIPSSVQTLTRDTFAVSNNVAECVYYNANAEPASSQAPARGYPAFRYLGYNNENGFEIVIGQNVITLMSYLFVDCFITKVNIPESLVDIQTGTLQSMSTSCQVDMQGQNPSYRLVNNCLVSGSTVIIGFPGFIIPTDNSITTIGISAFSGVNCGTTLDIPNNITIISDYGFADQQNVIGYTNPLRRINIGSGVISIGTNAFGVILAGTPVYTEIYFYMDNITTLSTYVFKGKSSRSVDIYCKPTNTAVINYNWSGDSVVANIQQIL